MDIGCSNASAKINSPFTWLPPNATACSALAAEAYASAARAAIDDGHAISTALAPRACFSSTPAATPVATAGAPLSRRCRACFQVATAPSPFGNAFIATITRAFLQTLQGRERVRVVCIDLSSPYRALIRKWFPNARILADRFHVIRVVIQHFMTLCRQIAPEIKNSSGSLAALRMNPSNLTQRRKHLLARLFAAHPALEPLYTEMQRLRALLNLKHQSRRSCKPLTRELLAFIQRLASSCFEPLVTLANTLRACAEPIACMWRFSKNNGITEGFHRKMKLIQRRAYGFRNFENYRLRVIAQCG